MSQIYITIYTRENDKVEFTEKDYFASNKVDRATPHRLDGPAIIFSDPNLGSHYFIDGDPFSQKDYWQEIQNIKNMPLELRLIDPRDWVREMT
jgi:hypothetical protein